MPTNADGQKNLPLVIAGPVLRQCTKKRFVCWLVVSEPCAIRLCLGAEERLSVDLVPGNAGLHVISASRHLHYCLIDLPLAVALPVDQWIDYSLSLRPLAQSSQGWIDVTTLSDHFLYPGKRSLGFVLPSRVSSVLHGSCRKPHHRIDGDGLVTADQLLARLIQQPLAGLNDVQNGAGEDLPAWPSALVMSGDQVYVDDVAGPMLHAIHQVIALLKIPDESLACSQLTGLESAQALYAHESGFYRREQLLPRRRGTRKLIDMLFGGVEKPIFTTDSAHNHLITLAEVLGMYLLCWSPALWKHVVLARPLALDPKFDEIYDRERQAVEAFVAGLGNVQRLFAHIPVAMIFDDHDITDDWNLSRQWEEVVYGNHFSKRVVGNALIGYLLNQAWGNKPEAFPSDLLEGVQAVLNAPGHQPHDDIIDQLLHYDEWHFVWETSPPLIVLDTRTHRWRSELSPAKPSGLLNWEKLTDLQQVIKGYPAVLLVTPAPIFGVKLIEAIQRIFSYAGHPLMVDSENWMAHPGSAYGMLNIFRHPKTPHHFVILSGDVHYSFVYDVELRGYTGGPEIWQICSSGLRNQFPPKLLDILDRASRWLYSPRSPLNRFTRRRHMRVTPRKPEGMSSGRRLLNGSGIGVVELDNAGTPWRIRQFLCQGPEVAFARLDDEAHWG